MTVQEIGITLVIVGFVAWAAAWVGLAAYGLVWLPRDRVGGSISLIASMLILIAGLLVLAQTPGGFK